MCDDVVFSVSRMRLLRELDDANKEYDQCNHDDLMTVLRLTRRICTLKNILNYFGARQNTYEE